MPPVCIARYQMEFASRTSEQRLKVKADYSARKGKFAYRGGNDGAATSSDLRLESVRKLETIGDLRDFAREKGIAEDDLMSTRSSSEKLSKEEKERFSKLLAKSEYASRTGQFSYRKSRDNPITPGETSGHCFCQEGLYDSRMMPKEVLAANSNMCESIVSIQRDDCVTYGMDNKEAFERLLRAKWYDVVETWGLIQPKDVRWYAAYHVDGHALHCHVYTWDASGRWGGRNTDDIPKEKLLEGSRILDYAVRTRRPFRENALERGYLRDAITARIRHHLRVPVEQRLIDRCVLNMEECRSPFSPIPRQLIGEERAAAMLARISDSSPDGRITQYARAPKEVREAVKDTLAELRQLDPEIDRMFNRLDEVLRERGEMNWMRDKPIYDRTSGTWRNELDSYVAEGRYDVQKRACNAIIKAAARVPDPWRSDKGTREAREAERSLREAHAKGDEKDIERKERAYAEALGKLVPGRDLSEDRLLKRASCRRVESAARGGAADREGKDAKKLAREALRGCESRWERERERVTGNTTRKDLEDVLRDWKKANTREERSRAAEKALSIDIVRERVNSESRQRWEDRGRSQGFKTVRDEVRTEVSKSIERQLEAREEFGGRVSLDDLASALACAVSSAGGGSRSSGHSGRSRLLGDRDRGRGSIARELDASRDSMRGR